MSHIYRTPPAQRHARRNRLLRRPRHRCAVAWLAEQGLEIHCYTADLAQPDEANPAEIPPSALEHGARAAQLVDCREGDGARGAPSPFNRGRSTSRRGPQVLQHHAARARGDDHRHHSRHARRRGQRVRRREHPQGNDIQRFYRYGLLVNPELKIYKPWLDAAFVSAFGGRTEMSEYLAKIGKPYRMGTEKAYSTDANVLGATHEAKDLEHLDKRNDDREPPSWPLRSGSRRSPSIPSA